MKFIGITSAILSFLLTAPAVAKDQCDLKNNYLISQSGEKYPILSITDCFGVDLKLEDKHIPKQCLSYNEANHLSKRFKYGFVAGISVIEINYHNKNVFLERYESSFSSPTLSLAMYEKIPSDRRNLKKVCKIPYPSCEYNFDPTDSGLLSAEIPPRSGQTKIVDLDPSQSQLAKKYYGKLVSEVLVERKCHKK